MALGGLLQGIRVLDFGEFIASGFTTRIMADMGAEILKVERYLTGDPLRSTGGKPGENGEAFMLQNTLMLNMNTGKKSISVDMRKPEGVEILKKLVPFSDVVVDGGTPGQKKKFGLDYESLKAIKPDIIYAALSPYGQYGPYRDWVAFARPIEGMSGLAHMTGEPDRTPLLPGAGIGDYNAAVHGCLAIVAAIAYHRLTGIGQFIDTAMLDSMMWIQTNTHGAAAITNGKVDHGRFGRHHDKTVPMGIYECHGEYATLQIGGSSEESTWGHLCHAMGRPDMITDSLCDSPQHRLDNREKVIGMIQEWFNKQPSVMDAVVQLQKFRVPCTPVLSPAQLMTGPQAKERKLTTKIYHPEIDMEAAIMVTPYKFSETPVRVERGTPLVGQHNEEILKQFLSYSDEQIGELYRKNVIYHNPRVLELRAKGKI